MPKLSAETARDYVAATQGLEPEPIQAERLARVANAFGASLATSAAQSLFDTEPEHLQAVLVALADAEGLPR